MVMGSKELDRIVVLYGGTECCTLRKITYSAVKVTEKIKPVLSFMQIADSHKHQGLSFTKVLQGTIHITVVLLSLSFTQIMPMLFSHPKMGV